MMNWRAIAMLGLALVAGVPVSVSAEDATKSLPTLMIKGEIVSLDNAEASAVLIKVRDRYGFETPIFVNGDSKVQQGDATVATDQIAVGNQVDVEYNFDVNTAKRHAVSVKLNGAKSAAPAAASTEPVPSAPAASTSTDAPAATATPAAPSTSGAPAQ